MLPPVPLFGSQVYQLRPHSSKSWWWWLTIWRLFTPHQKKGQLISEHAKGSLTAAIRSPPDKGTRQECWNIASMNGNFSVTFTKPLNQSSIKSCLEYKHNYNKCLYKGEDLIAKVVVLSTFIFKKDYFL